MTLPSSLLHHLSEAGKSRLLMHRAFWFALGFGAWLRVMLFAVCRVIDTQSITYPPHPSGYELDEVRAFKNRLIIDFSSNGLLHEACTSGTATSMAYASKVLVFSGKDFGCGGRIGPVRRVIDTQSITYPPHPSGYGPQDDEQRSPVKMKSSC